MNNESKVRCEHNTQYWSYKNKLGDMVSFGAVLTGQIDLETNETYISDHLELTRDSAKDEISEFASRNLYRNMGEDLEEQLRG